MKELSKPTPFVFLAITILLLTITPIATIKTIVFLLSLSGIIFLILGSLKQKRGFIIAERALFTAAIVIALIPQIT